MDKLLIGVLVIALGMPVSLAVQGNDDPDQPIDRKTARESVKQADRLLKEARSAGNRGDRARMEEALDRYAHKMGRLENGLRRGELPPADREEVADRVARSTSRHTGVLEGLLDKVSPEGRKGVERALQVSRQGHETALENLKKERERGESRRGVRRGERSGRGSPDVVRPGSDRGPPGRPGGPGRAPGRPPGRR